ncbi:M23 family metallopeptidase [Salinibacterium sp.]|uniref:M23 family metallopeptidase n=1 Tax=Salinibacterium sp. TaxID=1915057 RepID=UPI00286AF17F|nr:M23 family metallopeptidase [Salinibacterium sp.]
MSLSFRSSFLPSSALDSGWALSPGFIGVIRSHRRSLVLAAIASAGLLTSIPSLPPGAFASEDAAAAAQGQSLTTSAGFDALPTRDGFAMSTFSVVQWPVPASAPISSGFGLRECDGCSTDHTGTDFNPGAGYPIQAISAGIVTEAGWDSTGYGNRVVVQHVIDGTVVSSLYAHLQDDSIAVSIGDTVARGQLLGLVGSTGQSTGAHLHLSIIVGGEMIDPYPWLVEHVNS